MPVSNYKVKEPLIISIAIAVGMLLGYSLFNDQDNMTLIESSSIDSEMPLGLGQGRIEEMLRIIENSYVDDIASEQMIEKNIKHLIAQLDPFSQYIPLEEMEAYNEKMEGKYKGIGIESVFIEDSLFINRVIPGSPADEVGLIPGMKILMIAEDSVIGSDWNMTKVRRKLRDWEDDTIDFLVSHPQLGVETKELNLMQLVKDSASNYYLLDEDIGYLEIDRFSANTYDQFFKSLEQISEASSSESFKLILDLRNNPGGYLPQALRILSQLFPEKDKLLTYTIGEHRKKKEYFSTGRNFFDVSDIIVLINENSASASEIVAGAIQDWDRGILIGQSSYGKGLVQEIFNLKNGSAVRLTVARYCTPSGRQIQKPYVVSSDTIQQDSAGFQSKIYARELTNNGGVVPDIFIDSDGYLYNPSVTSLVAKRILPYTTPINEKILADETAELSTDILTKIPLLEKEDVSDFQLRAELIYSWHGKNAYKKFTQRKDPYIAKSVEVFSFDEPVKSLVSKEF